MKRSVVIPRFLWPVLAALAIVAAFLVLNHGAYDGFFQDDELDNIKWAPSKAALAFLTSFLRPQFEIDNFRPVGHLYFALMGGKFGLDFAPYITPIFVIHLVNALLLYLLMRRLAIEQWYAIAAAAFFTLSATAFDAYWKPMFVFDLLCTTFSLASILLYSRGRWILSFIAFWCAYKSKELAVMLPAVLAAYEYWFGQRKFKVLIPFFLASLNFGIQGIAFNPNKDNNYSFRFTPHALGLTTRFYAARFLLFPWSGVLLLALAFVRDRRVWFGLAAMSLLMVPLMFLPGRLFEAYAYLPLACAAISLAAAASHRNAVWAWVLLVLWMPFNILAIHRESRTILYSDDMNFAFVDNLAKWVRQNPDIDTLVFDGRPPGFHDWGITAAWSILHKQLDLPALYIKWPEAQKVMASQTVALGSWDQKHNRFNVSLRSPRQ